MKKTLTRRDFLNGAAVGITAGATLPPLQLFANEIETSAHNTVPKDYYPPTLTGMRGSHDGSFDVAHALAWRGEKPQSYANLEEDYDLVVVGSGISGLAAAYLYRKKHGADSRILILDNHDDFGGHAKRNEFYSGGRMLLAAGGSGNLEQYNFSSDVEDFIAEIGIDLEALNAALEPNYMLAGLDANSGLFLNKERYGQSRRVLGNWSKAWMSGQNARELISELDLPADQQQRLIALVEGERDLTNELSLFETKRYIESTSYEAFLSSRAGLSPETIALLEPILKLYWGLGAECPSVAEALMVGLPGARSLGFTGKLFSKAMSYGAEGVSAPWFPDGNSSVARLLVRHLIPAVAPGSNMEDVVTARFDYSQLDRAGWPVRLRLNSTAVNVSNIDDGVSVSYVESGQAYTVRSRHCVLACYNGLIPHLCPEIPDAQKENLKYGVKIPLVMANVLLRSGKAVNATGTAQYFCPGSYFESVTKAAPVSLGEYRDESNGSGPLVLWMPHAPAPRREGDQTARDLYRLGRHRLYTTPFSTFEFEIRKQLTEMFEAYGFDADRDIEAITVNRWSHGYTYDYLDLFDPDWESGQAPHELGRAPVGNITIANSDSEAQAYLHAAIDAAYRAVSELEA